jgi:thioredoxin-related protein
MRKIILSIVFLFIQIYSFAQIEKGIQFVQNMTWEQVIAKAQKEDKYIFVDLYTTWCGPCKMLDNGAFASPKTGAYFSKNLISYKLQMDKTKIDSDEIKNMYVSVDFFANTYNINMYPTLMLFNSKGEYIHRIAGGGNTTDDQLIEQIKMGMNSETQSFTLKKRYDNGDRTPEFLKIYANYLIIADIDNKLALTVCLDYLKTQTNWSAVENKLFVYYSAWKPKSEAFNYIKEHPADFDEYFIKNYDVSVKQIVESATKQECFDDALDPKTNSIDAEKLEKNLEKYFSVEIIKPIVLKVKINQAEHKEKVDSQFIDWVNDFLPSIKFGLDKELNYYAWLVYEKTDNKKDLKNALLWALESVKLNSEAYNNDTVAHLLYKIDEDLSLAKKYAERTIELSDKKGSDTTDIKNLLKEINARL